MCFQEREGNDWEIGVGKLRGVTEFPFETPSKEIGVVTEFAFGSLFRFAS